MTKFRFPPMNLRLFDGEGGAAPAAQGEATSAPATAQQAKKSEFDNVVFGKQPEAEHNSAVQTTSVPLDEKKANWRNLINGDYAEFYQKDLQRVIDRRFKETKGLQAQVDGFQPIIDVLAQRYGETDIAKLAEKINADSAYWSEAAEEAGMTVEQYKEMQKLRRENKALQDAQKRATQESAAQQQLQKWYKEAETIKGKFPGFDLETEAQNEQFVSMLRSGVPMEHAYKVLHLDDMMMDAMSTTAARTEQRVTDNIRARGSRPAEAGAAAQSAHITRDDVTKLTRKERAEIARRALMGEKITF